MEIQDVHGVVTPSHRSLVLGLGEADRDVVEVPLGPCVARWDLRTRTKTVQPLHAEIITCVREHPEGEIVATTGFDRRLRFWRRGERWEKIAEHRAEAPLVSLDWSAGGSHVAACCRGGSLTVLQWDPAAQACREVWAQQPPEPGVKLRQAMFAPHGLVVLVDGANCKLLRVHCPLSGTPKAEVSLDADKAVLSMAQSLSGRYMVLGGDGRLTVVQWSDDGAKAVVREMPVGRCKIRTLAFADERHVVVQTDYESVGLVNLRSGAVTRKFGTEQATSAVRCIGVDESRQAVWVCGDSGIDRLCTRTSTRQHHALMHKLACCGVDWAGEQLVTGDLCGNLAWWQDGERVRAATTRSGTRCIRSRGQDVLIGTMGGGIFRIGAEGAPRQLVRLAGTVTCIEFLGGLPFFAAATTRGVLGMFEYHDRTGRSTSIVQHRIVPDEIWSVVFVDQGIVAVACEDKLARVVDVQSGRVMQELEGHSMAVTCVDYGAGTLVTSSDDRTVRVYSRRASGAFDPVRVLEANPAGLYITYCALSPDRALVAATTLDGYLWVWSLGDDDDSDGDGGSTPRVCAKIHGGSLEGLRWRARSSRDRVLAVCSADCSATVIDVPERATRQ